MMFINKLFKKIKKHKKIIKKIGLATTFFLFFWLIVFTAYNLLFWGKIYPNLLVANVSVSGMNVNQAITALSQNATPVEKIILITPKGEFEISSAEINLLANYNESALAAFSYFRTGNILYDFGNRIKAVFSKTNLGLRISINEESLGKKLSLIADEVETKPVYPSAKLEKGQIVIDPGSKGFVFDQKALRAKIGYNLAFNKNEKLAVPLSEIDPTLSPEETSNFQKRAEVLIGKSISFTFEESSFLLNDAAIIKLLDPTNEYREEAVTLFVQKTASEINRDPQDSTFVFENGRVNEFTPAREGVKVNEDTLINMIAGNLRALETTTETAITLDIPVTKTQPKVQTADVNNLGIKELVGKGNSKFAHSIVNRIHNIELAASKFKGVLVAPGEIFSFNRTVGDISEATGFKQAYIIKDGKTALGDGGGVCQVSTTLFRAVLNAGLPVIERRAHAYRVAYYEQGSPPGIDATVFDPTTDFKFKNDTANNILIQPVFDRKNAALTFELYGTADGRKATVSKPVVSDLIAPPEDLYVDDPTLPAGQVKQIDYKAWGSKVTFNYTVEKDGEIVYKKTFISNYQPWQAVYLRGTGPAQ